VQCQPKLADLCKAEDVPVLTQNWQTLLAGLPATLSIRFRPAGGAGKWVQIACVPIFDSSAGVIGVMGCATEIDAHNNIEHEAVTNRAAALEQLHLSESRLRNLVENALLGILIFDEDRRPSFANKTWFRMTEHPLVPAAHIDIRSVIFHEDLSQFEERMNCISATGKSVTFHVRLNRPWRPNSDFAQHAWVQFTAFTKMGDDESFQITTTITDISDFKFSEALQRARLQQAVEAKRQQEKLVSINRKRLPTC
jgi:PAS domain-containing protein